MALQVAYTRWLKHVVILDVMTIAMGFVLRAVAGGLVISVPVSDWLLVCTILLALFLGLSKRRHELTLLADGAREHRRILEEYDPYLLDQMIARGRRVHAGGLHHLLSELRDDRTVRHRIGWC